MPEYRHEPKQRRIASQSIGVIAGACVAERDGSVISPDNYLLTDIALAEPLGVKALRRGAGGPKSPEFEACLKLVAGSKVMNRGPLRHPKRYDESVAVIATRSCNNLYHWLVDALPRLRLVEASGLAVRRLYTPIWAAYHKQALDLLGIDERQCIPAKRYQNIVASEIILPSSPPGFPTQEVCEFLWTKLLPPALRMTAATNRRRLYISRRNARWRRIANEPDLVDLLGEHGFERIELENFPLVEQIRLMHEAEFVVGPHGAGLTHLAFCKPGTRVLEINTPCRPIHCFYHIAYWRGLRYLNLVGEQNGAAAHFGEDSNIIVDLGRAERALKLLDDIAPLNPTEHAS